jgi:hypothetical protein
MGTDLDDNGGDGLIGAEVGVGAAGVLLRELAHDLHRLVAGIGRCSPPPDSIQCISNFSVSGGICGRGSTLSSDGASAGAPTGRRRRRADWDCPAPDGG